MANVSKSWASNPFVKFCDCKSLKGVRSHSCPNLIPKFPCLKMSGFEHLRTTIILSSKGKLEFEAQRPSQMHDVIFFVLNMDILDHIFSIVPRMFICNISTSREIVEMLSIKSHNIVSIF